MNAPAHKNFRSGEVELGALTDTLGFMLRMAQLVSYEQFFRQFPKGDVLPGEFTVLWVIWLNPGIRQGDVAKALNIKPAHMTKLVKRMKAAGLIERCTAPEDRRAILLSLTDKGQTEIQMRRDAFFYVYSPENTGLTRREFEQLLALLGKFASIRKVLS